MIGRDEATDAQVRAAHPARSSWVSANAGSGKTRVLTDRVARLLIRGVDPRRILCLTYTKAAAAEMQNRLFKRLGAWAMLGDADLRAALGKLDEDATGIADRDLAAARRLFAGALEVPGGLKIQTIHSFCDSLLRRFPLEAGISPDVQVMEDRQAAQLRQDVLEGLAADPGGGFAALVPHVLTTEQNIGALLSEITTHRARFRIDPDGQALLRTFGLDAAVPKVIDALTAEEVSALLAAHQGVRTKGDQARLPLLDALARRDEGAAQAEAAVMLKADGGLRKLSPAKALVEALPEAQDLLERVQVRFAALQERERAKAGYDGAQALIRFGRRFLEAYDAAKRVRGMLDYDDLIALAGDLLTAREASAWVSYKLDGGIDHVLVDEAQDTSPGQWRVVDALVREFHAGEGQRMRPGTLFVVGDPKQSIYSFQGADPAAFGDQQLAYGAALDGVEETLEVCDLRYSFRSSPVILQLVDQVLATADAGVAVGAGHRAFNTNMPGRVELWPLEPLPPDMQPPDPWEPEVLPTPAAAERVLADRVARHVAQMIHNRVALPGTGRVVGPGDILILVRSRNEIFRRIIRRLKAEGVPVAGADRLRVLDELAVRDLVALLSAVVTPEDDLSLAAALKSPIFGFGERDLYGLAHGRGGSLAAALADSDFAQAAAVFSDLRARADFLRPYELLDRILTRHGARPRLVARLGPEADDAVAALLDLALDYERVEPPSLTGFLDWLQSSDAERKRQMEIGRSEVRVMTVHGAKGLEAPVVILPDTMSRASSGATAALQSLGPDAIALSGTTATRPAAVQREVDLARRLDREEHARLLYVAMTRAERWLIVCGAANKRPPAERWYAAVETAMVALGAEEAADGTKVLQRGWVTGAEEPLGGGDGSEVPAALPAWLTADPGAPPDPEPVLTPSGAGHGASTQVKGALEPETARRRGTLLHLLLEQLPGLSEAEIPDRAADLLAEATDRAEADAVLAAARRVLAEPDFRWIFGPESRAEQEICGRVAALGGRIVRARADRLVMAEDALWVVDFKSDTLPPAPVPEDYLTQLALYVSALSEVVPDRPVRAAILWTVVPRLDRLDPEDVRRVLQSLAAH